MGVVTVNGTSLLRLSGLLIKILLWGNPWAKLTHAIVEWSTLIWLEGGGQFAHTYQNNFLSGTDCPIDLKPSCTFKLVRFYEVYVIPLDLEGCMTT